MEKKNKFNPKNWNKRVAWTTAGVTLAVGAVAGAMVGGAFIGGGNSGFKFDDESQIAYVPNQETLYDASFNEGTLNGAENYGNAVQKNVKTFVPEDGGTADILRAIGTATSGNTHVKGILTNGFTANEAVEQFLTADGNENMYVIQVDDMQPIAKFDDGGNEIRGGRGIAADFRAEEAGFLGGLSASIYAHSQNIENPSESEVVMWGGADNPGVTPFMSGFEQAVNYYNYKVLDILPIDNEGINISSSLNGETINVDYETTFANNSNDQRTSFYEGTFDMTPKSEAGAQRAETYADVIFPVAGGQVNDAMNQADNMKVIGVDTDLTLKYSTEEEQSKILGSSTKNLADATTLSMWYAERWTEHFGQDFQLLQSTGNAVDRGFYSMLNNPDAPWIMDQAAGLNEPTLLISDIAQPGNKDVANLNVHLKGTYDNGGSGFTKSIGGPLEMAIDILAETGDYEEFTVDTTFESFATVSMLENPKIEKFSRTFTDPTTPWWNWNVIIEADTEIDQMPWTDFGFNV